MKKIIVCYVFIFALILSSCSLFQIENDTTTTEEYISPYATNVDGVLVPKHENVNEAKLNPKEFFIDEKGRMAYADSSQKTLSGIDVSVFQGEIDWEKVAEDGIQFAMIRVGYRGYGSKGIMEIDENFEKNYQGAKDAGLKVGVYFYSQALNTAEAKEEANFVIDVIKDLDLDFPVAYDWEYVDNENARTKDMTGDKITDCALSFCEEIKSNGFQTVIYFNCEIGYFDYNLQKVSQYDFWLAEYNHYPSFLYDYKIWQYSKQGTVSGIDGKVDLNIAIKDYSLVEDTQTHIITDINSTQENTYSNNEATENPSLFG